MIRSEFPTTRAYTERKPLGVIASFGPWNVAQFLSWRAVVAPLAAGNTVVLKPSEESPFTSGILIAQVLEEAGFPAGTVNVVTHSGPPPSRPARPWSRAGQVEGSVLAPTILADVPPTAEVSCEETFPGEAIARRIKSGAVHVNTPDPGGRGPRAQRRRQGQRLGPFRRRGPRRLHRAPVDDRRGRPPRAAGLSERTHER